MAFDNRVPVINKGLNWFWFPAMAFIVLRAIIIFVLYKTTGGSEFTSDTWVYELGLKPFSVITFSTDVSGYSQPPLFPIALMPFAALFSTVFNDFLASRISFSCFEFISFLIIAYYLAISRELSSSTKSIILFILAISPLGFMTGTVMRQEETIVIVFVSAILLAVKKDSIRCASLITLLGIITAKILLGIFFFPLLLIAKKKMAVVYWGILPLVLFLTVYCSLGYLLTGNIPFIEFAPSDTQFCASPFTLILYFQNFSGPFIKWLSLGMMAVILLIVWRIFPELSKYDFPVTVLLTICILYLFFYHVNTEYHIFILPLLVIVPYFSRLPFSVHWINGIHLILAISTWGYGIIYGIRVFSEGGSSYSHSKELALKLYENIIGFIPIKIFEISLLLLTLISIFLILIIGYRLLQSKAQLLLNDGNKC